MTIPDDPVLRRFLAAHADHASEQVVAVFDCDGTIIRGDIGEAMLYHQIERFNFRISPAQVWEDHPHRGELGDLFRTLDGAAPAQRARHDAFEPFARMILAWYFGQIEEGKVAKACADIVRLFAGYSPAELRTLADETLSAERSAPLSDRTLGGYTRPRGVRYFRESVAILRKLQELHFDIWVVSGSNRWSVESVFRPLGVPPERIVGIDLTTDHGICTADVTHPVPVRENKVTALKLREPRVPLLVASDSRNDLPLFLYASDVKLYINSRRKKSSEFFSLSDIVRDESWIVVERPTPEE